MEEFIYNHTKNTSIGPTPFELNCSYYFWMLYKKKIDPYSKFQSTDKLSVKLRELIIVCQENLYYIQECQKRAYNKRVKPQSYVLGNKIWLNSKYIKT